MKSSRITFLSLLMCCQLCAIDVTDFGISITLKTIVSHERNVMLLFPDGRRVISDQLTNLQIPINKKELKIQGQIEQKPPFTKILISQAEDQFVIAHFYFTMTPTKEMLPVQTAQIGFRYPALTEVVPNTTSSTGTIDLIAYKQNNSVSITIDIFGKGSIAIERSGDWIVVLKQANTLEPWRKMSIKNVLNAQRQPLQASGNTATDKRLIDQVIMTNKIGSVEVDPNNTIILLTK